MRAGILFAGLLLGVALAACDRSNDAPTVDPHKPDETATKSHTSPQASRTIAPRAPKTGETAAITLDWTMVRDGAQLRIAYTIVNNTKQRIAVVDRLLRGPGATATSVVVHNSGTPGTVAFSRAYIRSFAKTVLDSIPAVRVINPGKTFASVAVVPLPLVAWHNFGSAAPLEQPAKSAVLQVGWMNDPGPNGWIQRLKDGSRVPDLLKSGPQRILRSAPKPIPR